MTGRVGRRILVLHDAFVLDIEQVFEVLLDRPDGILLPYEIRRLLGDHHLRRVRVAADRVWNDGGVDDTKVLETSNSEDGRPRAINGVYIARLHG